MRTYIFYTGLIYLVLKELIFFSPGVDCVKLSNININADSQFLSVWATGWAVLWLVVSRHENTWLVEKIYTILPYTHLYKFVNLSVFYTRMRTLQKTVIFLCALHGRILWQKYKCVNRFYFNNMRKWHLCILCQIYTAKVA